MKKLQTNVEQLIEKLCRNELSLKEKEILEHWIKEDPQRKEKVKEIKELYVQARSVSMLEQMDLNDAWRKIDQAVRPKKKITMASWFPYAAASIFILLVSSILVYQINRKYQALLSDGYVESYLQKEGGKNIPTLTLADGSSVKLHKEEIHISESDGTSIQKDTSNLIRYQKNDQKCSKLLYNTINVPRGGEYNLYLSDGTRVRLNSATILKYPTKFTGKERKVELLAGEAFFEVAHDKSKAFLVTSRDAEIKVLGTKFNVSSYEDQEYIATTLVEGSVQVSTLGEKETLKPGYQSTIKRGENDICVKEVNTRLFTSWIDGVFEFENTNLEIIMAQLSRWYDIDFFFTENSIKQICFTGAIKKDKPLGFSVKMIEKVAKVKFEIKDNYVIVKR